MALWLDINPRSGVPIYIQLIDQVQRALEVGSLQPGDQLPTVRQLSSALTIAPNTIVKAYNELQRLGLIESRPGVGTTVVATAAQVTRQRQAAALIERLHALVRDAFSLGISADELRVRFDEALLRFAQEPAHQEDGA